MISNHCARKSLVINCNSIVSKNNLRFLVDSNEKIYKINYLVCYLYNMKQFQKKD